MKYVVCPSFSQCSVTNCEHRSPHKKKDSCSKIWWCSKHYVDCEHVTKIKYELLKNDKL
jgi:hypothetical protein